MNISYAKIIATFLVVITSCVMVQAQNWTWGAGAVGPGGDDEGHGISTDANGNVYVAGRAQDTLNWGTMSTMQTAAGFLAMYDSAGSLQWVDQTVGSLYEFWSAVSTDDLGNSVVAGGGRDTFMVGGTTIQADQLDILLAKYDNTGTVTWVKNIGSNQWDGANDCAMDGSGNIYVTGYIRDSLDFEGTTVNSASPGKDDIFIAKFDGSGTLVWVQHVGESDYEAGAGICVDANGNVYATGYYRDSITFGSTTYSRQGTITSNNTWVAKWDAAGNFQWAVCPVGADDQYHGGEAIAVDSDGNVYVAGWFTDSLTWGSTVLVGESGQDAYLVKLDSNGTAVWAKAATGPGFDNFRDVSLDGDDGVLVTGGFGDTLNIGTNLLESANGGDLVVARYDPMGNLVWVTQGNGLDAQTDGYALHSTGEEVYVTGRFDSSITIGSNTLTGVSGAEVLVAVMNDTASSTSPPVGMTNYGPIGEGTVSLSPNPFGTSSLLHVQNYDASQGQLDIRIYSLLGTELQHVKSHSVPVRIYGDHLRSGLYLYDVGIAGKRIGLGKLIIER